MQIFREIEPLRAFLVEKRRMGLSIGFVPTMGALHEGHLSLIKASLAANSLTVCSIYVNPIQFNSALDFDKYPRMLELDSKLLENLGCDVLFCPQSADMEVESSYLKVDFGALSSSMEGKYRPGHFSGVAKVVSKLFHVVEPDQAYFGQKDWQQFLIIRSMVNELKFTVKLHWTPTYREPDGLAMASRNLRLSKEQREQAPAIYGALTDARYLLKKGANISDVKSFVKNKVESNPTLKLEYFEIVDSENLSPINHVEDAEKPILCIAAYAGEVRLIDNMFL